MTSTTMRATSVPVSFVMGSAITVVLFWGLQQLISAQLIVVPRIHAGTPLFTRLVRNSVEPVPTRTKPQPPTSSPEGGPGVRIEVTQTPVVLGPSGPGMPDTVFDPGTPQSQPMPLDQDAMQRVTPQPAYPESAKTRGIEGWVLVEFTVTAAGVVANPVVIDAEPKGTFDNAVLRAVNGWKYSPRISNGVAVERPGMRVVLKFHLED